MKKGNAIFAFALKNKEGNTENWHIDLKDKGLVAKGEAPEGKKADGRFLLFPTNFPKCERWEPRVSLLAEGPRGQGKVFEKSC